MKVTSVSGGYYHIKNESYNSMGRNLLNLSVGDDIEMIGWSDSSQTYRKVLVNGYDITAEYNRASNANVESLKSWASNRRNELLQP